MPGVPSPSLKMKPKSSPRKKAILAAATFSGICAAMGLVTNVMGSAPLDIGQLVISAVMLAAAAYLSIYASKIE